MSGSKKISELTSATALTGDEVIVVVQDGETRQANVQKLNVFQLVRSVNNLQGDVILAASDVDGLEPLVAEGGVTPAIASVSVRIDETSAAVVSVQTYLLAQISSAAATPQRPTLVTVSTSTHSPTNSTVAPWFLLTNTAGCSITIPTSASVGFPLYTLLTYEQDGTSPAVFVGEAGITIRSAPGTSAETAGVGAVVQLFKRTSTFWTIYGALKQST